MIGILSYARAKDVWRESENPLHEFDLVWMIGILSYERAKDVWRESENPLHELDLVSMIRILSYARAKDVWRERRSSNLPITCYIKSPWHSKICP